jgi:hypothetical protein
MSSANISVAEPAKRGRKPKASSKRLTKGKSRSSAASPANGKPETVTAAAGTLTRTKALLLAALRVWELKHRIND